MAFYSYFKVPQVATSLAWISPLEHYLLLLNRNSKDMPSDVIKCLKETISKYGNLSEEETEQYFNRLENNRRLQCETWS